MSEIVIGFDVRWNAEVYVQKRWSIESRKDYLLNPSIEWPLSVDTSVWPTVFSKTNSKPADFSKNVVLAVNTQDFRYEAIGLWSNLHEMDSLLKKNNFLNRNQITIAVTVFRSETDIVDYWGGLLKQPTMPVQREQKWELLGYDIADRYFISGLSNCGYGKAKKALATIWGKRLNNFGILKNISDAIEFRDITNGRVPEHVPFLIYGLYKVKK